MAANPAAALSDDEALRQKRVAACLAMLSAPTSPTSPRPSIRSAARACNLPKSTVHRLLQQARGGSPPSKRARRNTAGTPSPAAAPTIARRPPPRKSALTFILCVSDANSTGRAQKNANPATAHPQSPPQPQPQPQPQAQPLPQPMFLPAVSAVSNLSSASCPQPASPSPLPEPSTSALTLSQLTSAAERARSCVVRDEDDTHVRARAPRKAVQLPQPRFEDGNSPKPFAQRRRLQMEEEEHAGAMDPAWALMSLMQRPTSRTSRCSA